MKVGKFKSDKKYKLGSKRLEGVSVYFDTSAINRFAQLDYRTVADTKSLMEKRGNTFYLSSTAIWEMLSNSDADRRESLLLFPNYCLMKGCLLGLRIC